MPFGAFFEQGPCVGIFVINLKQAHKHARIASGGKGVWFITFSIFVVHGLNLACLCDFY